MRIFIWFHGFLSIFTNPSAQAGYDTWSIFKRSLTGLIQSFPSPRLVSSARRKNPSWRENNWIHTFPNDICAIQSDSSRIRTRVAASIFYDHNYYTTGTFTFLSNTNNFQTVVRFQAFSSNTNYLDTIIYTQLYIHNYIRYLFISNNSYIVFIS